ncbi:hypothetical protein VNI00_008004 [Paramarasmius palmivorus]|uniref:WW domain-containing protein n=1 Tax=Paramarasmius palmivorus TaxID=297713 RepID=A0AAW0CYZ5_9AGAR
MFRDSPLMIPHLQNVLGTIPPSVAMSAVLGQWDVALWSDVSKADVDLAVRDIQEFAKQWGLVSYLPAIPNPPIYQPEGIKFLFEHQCMMSGMDVNNIPAALKRMGVQTAGFHFFTLPSVLGRLWAHQDASVQRQSLTLLQNYEASWKLCSDVENDTYSHLAERLAFTLVLAKHINCTDRNSLLIMSKCGQEFIRFIHHEIITQKLYWTVSVCVEWLRAIKRTREVGNLPLNYFAPVPDRRDPIPVLPPLPPRQYSLETEPDVELNHDNEAPGSQLEPPLPSGWEQLITPEGRPYFFDHKIGTVTWEDPRQNILPASGSQLDGPLPFGWEQKTTGDGRPYFFHRKTQSSSSGNPQALGSQPEEPLPLDWEQRTALGTPYFFDLNTRAVFWKDPRRFYPTHQVAESSGSGNPQASGSQPEGPLPPGWGQGTFLGTPYFFDRRTYTATWKDPRQIDPAGQVVESSGSGNQRTSQDDNHATPSRSQAVEGNTNPDSGTLPDMSQQSSSDPALNNAEVEGLSGISSSDIQGDAPMSPSSSSSTIRPTDHSTRSSDPLAPLVPPRTDDSNRDTQVSSTQGDGETSEDNNVLVIRIENTSREAESSYVPWRGHADAGDDGPSQSHSDSAHLQRHVEHTGADRTSAQEVVHPEPSDSSIHLGDAEVPGSAPAAPSTGDIDMDNMNGVVRSPASGEGHTISQDRPPPAVGLRVNEQMISNRSVARIEEQHTRSSRDTDSDENVHPEISSIVTGRGYTASTDDPTQLSGKDQDSPLPGETSVLHPDDSESTARARDAASSVPAHSAQDNEQAPELAHSEQDVQGSDVSQREGDRHTTDEGQTRAHPAWVDHSNESHADAEILGHRENGTLINMDEHGRK